MLLDYQHNSVKCETRYKVNASVHLGMLPATFRPFYPDTNEPIRKFIALSAGFVDGSTGPPIDPGEDVMLYSQRANQIRLEDAVKRLLADSAKRRRKRSNTEGISGVTPHSDGKKIIPRVPLGRWRRESAVTQRASIDRDLWRQQVRALNPCTSNPKV